MSEVSQTNSFFSEFPVLDLGEFTLRNLKISDVINYYRILNDPKVNRFLSDEDIPKSLEESEESIRFWGSLFDRRRSIFWSIATKSEDKIIGTVGFNNWNFLSRRGEISYELASEYWRCGIMSRVLGRVIEFAFDKMKLNRIEAKTMTNNLPSIKTLERFRFKYEGTLEEYRLVREKFIDVNIYALLRSNYLNQ